MRIIRAAVLAFAVIACIAGAAWRLVAATAPLPPLPKPVAHGALAFAVTNASTGELIPCKLTFLGTGGTPDPRFTSGDIGREEDGGVSAYNRFYSLTGTGIARLPLGTYDVYVSRGPEWDRYVARNLRIDVRGAELRAPLRHVIETPGWLSADFHVHAAKSPDSHVPMLHRVYQFVADGVEMIVSTDHNVVSDYGPFIAEVGAGKYITSALGDELTTNGWGHFGAFPLPEDLESAGHGAILVRGRTARDFFRDVRQADANAVIDVHHPRIDHEIGYFHLGQLDAKNDVAGRPGFSFDFDSVEVLNGYQDPERRSLDHLLDDWYQLLLHGHIVTATGNSDSHHLTLNIGGYPRNYVAVHDDHPAQVKPAEIARAVRGHHSYFTTGPILDFKVGGGHLGDTVRAVGGKVPVQLDVRAAPWVAVDTVRLIVDGQEYDKLTIAPSNEIVRLHKSWEVECKRDCFIVARVDGNKTLAPVIGDDKRFTVYPIALTNPIFVDVDNDGLYTAPGKHGAHAPKDGGK